MKNDREFGAAKKKKYHNNTSLIDVELAQL